MSLQGKFLLNLFSVAASLVVTTPAVSTDSSPATAQATSSPKAVCKSRYAALVMDAETGNVLYNDCGDTPLPPASLTKLMTIYLTFQAIKEGKLALSDQIVFSDHARHLERNLGLPHGASLSAKEVLEAMDIYSANDAATAMAEKVGGDEKNFAALMTQAARNLQMQDTVFVDASGLANIDPASLQHTTARDIAILMRAITTEFSEYNALFRVDKIRVNGRDIGRHDQIMYGDPKLGVAADPKIKIIFDKTGFTDVAGFCIAVAARDSASPANDVKPQVIVVIMGASKKLDRALTAIDLARRHLPSRPETAGAMSVAASALQANQN